MSIISLSIAHRQLFEYRKLFTLGQIKDTSYNSPWSNSNLTPRFLKVSTSGDKN